MISIIMSLFHYKSLSILLWLMNQKRLWERKLIIKHNIATTVNQVDNNSQTKQTHLIFKANGYKAITDYRSSKLLIRKKSGTAIRPAS